MKSLFIKFNILLFLLCLSMVAAANSELFRWKLDDNQIILNVAGNAYIYSSSVNIVAMDSDGEKLELNMAKPTSHTDDLSGTVDIYGTGEHRWTAKHDKKIDGAKIEYQGCSAPSPTSNGTCYLPATLSLGNTFQSGTQSHPTQITGHLAQDLFHDFKVLQISEGEMNTEEFITFLQKGDDESNLVNGNIFANKSFYLVLVLVFLGGLVLNFTPCVLPMIPINLAIIGANGSNTKRQGFIRGMVYGLGMMLTYGLLGLLVVMGGAKFGYLNSSSVFNLLVALVFVILGLSMLEVFNIDFSQYQNKFNVHKMQGTWVIVALVMGATSALLAGACVAPVIIGMMLFASQLFNTGNYWGLILPFVFGMGMALPWPFAGWTIGVLPKPGKWMVRVKQIFAIFIFGGALYYGYIGYTLLPRSFSAATEIAELRLGLKDAQDTDKLVLIDFWASWCKNCTHMEKTVFKDAKVKEIIDKNYVLVKFQAEKFDDLQVTEVLDYFHLKGLPAFVILKPDDK